MKRRPSACRLSSVVSMTLLFLGSASAVVADGMGGTDASNTADAPLDLLIRGGTVFDGDLADGISADVGVRGEKIAFVGNAANAHLQAARIIDANGLIVAPGFIDAHVHTDDDLLSADPRRRMTVSDLAQGVTTNILAWTVGVRRMWPRDSRKPRSWASVRISSRTWASVPYGRAYWAMPAASRQPPSSSR